MLLASFNHRSENCPHASIVAELKRGNVGQTAKMIARADSSNVVTIKTQQRSGPTELRAQAAGVQASQRKRVVDRDYVAADLILSSTGLPRLKEQIAFATAAERERCARIAETCSFLVTDACFEYGSAQIAQAREDITTAIRNRDDEGSRNA